MIAFDANILIHATGGARIDKVEHAPGLVLRGLRSSKAVLLLQTLDEFCHVALAPKEMTTAAVMRLVEAWRGLAPVYPAQLADLDVALAAVRDHGLPFWDAVLWATVRRVGVRRLISENLQDGRTLESVRFLSPFAAANASLIARLLPG
jgi:predicted nucleic acid-binding protein